MTQETDDSDMSLAEAVLRQLIDQVPNLRMDEPPKSVANSTQVIFAPTRTDAKDGEEFRVWIQGPSAPMIPSDLRAFLKRQLTVQGFVVY